MPVPSLEGLMVAMHTQLEVPARDAMAEKPLKRGKSLTRSLSTAFRKSGRSRPTSPTSRDTPPTPHLPVEYTPQTAHSPHTRKAAFELPKTGKSDQNVDVAERAIAIEKEKEKDPFADPRLQVRKRKSMRYISLRHSRQESWTTGDDAPRPRTASTPSTPAVALGEDDGSIKHKKIAPKPRLKIIPGRSQSRSTSAAMPVPKGSPALPRLSRPATCQASLPSPTASSKSRRRGNSSPRNGYSRPPDPFDLPPRPAIPWQASYASSEVRSSFRSAVTTTSSLTNATGDSVGTKDTALTDVTVDSPTLPHKVGWKEEGMTVDEAIDMYAAGFTDDPEVPTESPHTSLSEEERRRSAKIAEAITDNMGSPELPPSTSTSPRPSTTGSTMSRSLRSASIGQSTLTHGRSFPYGASRDQYGFLKYNHHISRTLYDAWFAGYYPSQVRRGRKWKAYMKDSKLPIDSPTKFPSRSTKTQRYIRKGIPPAWRGSAWFYYAGGDSYLSRHPQLYNNLVHLTEQKLSDYEKEAIERDLHRTFPDNIRFKPEPGTSNLEETDLLTSLRRVLRAFALHIPKIGYCQSLNFITAMLLLFMPEEKAFWMLHIITVLYLPATHEVSLEGANVDLWVLAVALKGTLPGVWAKVGETGMTDDTGMKSGLPPISLCTTGWFMSLFIGTLPVETVLRVWDVLFYEGSRTLFRVALTIFKIGEQKIKSVGDSMELFQIVQVLPRGMVDAGKFMDVACRKGQVDADWIERMRGERRMHFAKQRAKTAGSGREQNEEEDEKEGKMGRKKSRWRKKTS